MLNLVPFTRAGGKVTNGKQKPGFVGQFLQLQFPEPQPRTVTATPVSRNQNLAGCSSVRGAARAAAGRIPNIEIRVSGVEASARSSQSAGLQGPHANGLRCDNK